ncbi:MAG: helix-turn-helix transcriptional regulator [Bacillota bacterium]
MNIADKIKDVRLKMFLSQEKFAKELGVSFATVNRWERGLCEPNYDGQKAFHEFCKKNNIDLDS